MKELRVLLLTKYDRLGASSRLRTHQYLPALADAGINVTVAPLLSDELLVNRYKTGKHRFFRFFYPYWQRLMWMLRCEEFDVIWIEKEALPWTPWWLEHALLRRRPYVLDYDDAVFHNYEFHRFRIIRNIFGRRLDELMARSALVIGGNTYLAQRARNAGCGNVEIVPTVVDLDRYRVRTLGTMDEHGISNKPLRLVWIGSPATVHYLNVIAEPLRELAQRIPLSLRVIGVSSYDLPWIEVEFIQWSEATEGDSIADADVGIMPLLDSPWEKGKCGYKLIQYMACGLPVVASDVGVNAEIVEAGQNGFLARTHEEWVQALEKLAGDHSLREKMGRAGRGKVETMYCIQKTGPKMASLLKNIVFKVQ